MPPKRLSSLETIVINTISTRGIRSNAASDLITKSEAALSSQASIYTQKTQGTQGTHDFNQGMADNEDMEFNREQMAQVYITKQEEEMIQKILELARKGKVNSKNAFEIPIKVVHSESNFSINNKFWKFASQLLSASMSIYDKRVENMYLSTGAFENKLSRIGFDIKNRKQGQRDDERLDDVNADQQARGRRNRQERQQILKISIEDFSGALNLEDQNIIGFETLQKKEKIDIKNVQNKFIADPTFQRTQKMFDSFSLKSLMLNIFELSPDLDVRIFYKSDLEWQKLKRNEKGQTQQQEQHQKNMKNHIQESRSQEQSLVGSPVQYQTVANKIQNKKFTDEMLSFNLEKHLEISKPLIEKNQLFSELQDFIVKQPELRQDYQARTKNQTLRNRMEIQNDHEKQNIEDISYEYIIQKERKQYMELINQFNECYDEQIGGHHFAQIQDGVGLFQTNQQSQSQTFEQSHQLSFPDRALSLQTLDVLGSNSMPVSFQENFYGWDEKSNIIEPIMPWQIEFKNLELKKKVAKGSKKQKKSSKKNSKNFQPANVDFDLQIMDTKQVLMQKDIKKSFQTLKFNPQNFRENHITCKDFDIVHTEHHLKFGQRFLSFRASYKKSDHRKQDALEDQPGKNQVGKFALDFDQGMEQNFGHSQKMKQVKNIYDEETQLLQSKELPQNLEQYGFMRSDLKLNKNTTYVGHQMGVNNIREIKKMIVDQVNQKGKTTLEHINKLLVSLSPQQLFTIFLHLTNQNSYAIISDDRDETTVLIKKQEKDRQIYLAENRKMTEPKEIQI